MKKYIVILLASIAITSCTSNQENKQVNFNNLSFTDIYTIQVDTLEMDMISDATQNSIYITYSSNNGLNENILKLNTSTLNPLEITHPDYSESREIEIVNNEIYSISSNDLIKLDLNLNIISTNSYFGNNTYYPRLIGYNNTLQLPRGLNNILEYDINTNIYNYPTPILTYMFANKNRMDGEIINDVMYAFGGGDMTVTPIQATNEIEIYDYLTNTWNTESLPFNVSESFTDKYNNYIFVTGNKLDDFSNGFVGLYDTDLHTYTTITTSIDFSTKSIRGVTILGNDIYIAYMDFPNTLPALVNVKIAKASLL